MCPRKADRTPCPHIVRAGELHQNGAGGGVLVEHRLVEFVFARPRITVNEREIIQIQTDRRIRVRAHVTQTWQGRIVGESLGTVG